MLAVLFWLLAGLLLLVLLVLALPVRLVLAARSAPYPHARLTARPLAGLSPPLPLFDSNWLKGEDEEEEGEPAPKETNEDEKKKRRGSGASRMLRVIKAGPRFLHGVFTALRFEHLAGEAEFGLPDPADTGQLYGLMTPLLYTSPLGRHSALAIRPRFEGAALGGWLEAHVRLTPLALAPPAAGFAWRVFGPR